MASPRSEEEVRALEDFKLVVKDLHLEDGTLMRYLREIRCPRGMPMCGIDSRNLDTKRASDNLRNVLEWKKTSVVCKRILYENWKPQPEFLNRFKSCYYCGVDSQQRIVLYLKVDDFLPIRPLFEEFQPVEFLTFLYQTFALLHQRLKATKQQQIIGIADVDGIGFRKVAYELCNWLGIQTIREAIPLVEQNFPETLFKAFIINTHKAGLWGYSIIKPMLPEYTAKKVKLYGCDQESWMSEMTEYLSTDVIPQEIGGSATQLIPLFDILFDNANQSY